MTIEFPFVEIEQPVGLLMLGIMNSSDIFSLSEFTERNEKNNEAQRRLEQGRTRSIANYCHDPDAIFPTPVILSITSDYINIDNERRIAYIDSDAIARDESYCFIIDGQHRIKGIHDSGLEEKFILPVIFVVDATLEQRAYIFSTINGNQKPVKKDLVYELLGIQEWPTIEKKCNLIIRELNANENSPLYRKIKLLGLKSEDNPSATVSQATLIKYLKRYITTDNQITNDNIRLKKGQELEDIKNENLIFRSYISDNQEAVVLKILQNYFSAMQEAILQLNFEEQEYLQKAAGYNAQFLLLKPLYKKGKSNKALDNDFFLSETKGLISNLLADANRPQFSSASFGSSDAGARSIFHQLLRYWIECCSENIEFLSRSEARQLETS